MPLFGVLGAVFGLSVSQIPFFGISKWRYLRHQVSETPVNGTSDTAASGILLKGILDTCRISDPSFEYLRLLLIGILDADSELLIGTLDATTSAIPLKGI